MRNCQKGLDRQSECRSHLDHQSASRMWCCRNRASLYSTSCAFTLAWAHLASQTRAIVGRSRQNTQQVGCSYGFLPSSCKRFRDLWNGFGNAGHFSPWDFVWLQVKFVLSLFPYSWIQKDRFDPSKEQASRPRDDPPTLAQGYFLWWTRGLFECRIPLHLATRQRTSSDTPKTRCTSSLEHLEVSTCTNW